MRSDDASPSLYLSAAGTPADYTEGLYRLYFEIRDADGAAERIIRDFLGAERAGQMCRLAACAMGSVLRSCATGAVRLFMLSNQRMSWRILPRTLMPVSPIRTPRSGQYISA